MNRIRVASRTEVASRRVGRKGRKGREEREGREGREERNAELYWFITALLTIKSLDDDFAPVQHYQ